MVNIEKLVEELYQEISDLQEQERQYWYREYFIEDFTIEERETTTNIMGELCKKFRLYFDWKPMTSQLFCFYLTEDEGWFEHEPPHEKTWVTLHNGYGYWQYNSKKENE